MLLQDKTRTQLLFFWTVCTAGFPSSTSSPSFAPPLTFKSRAPIILYGTITCLFRPAARTMNREQTEDLKAFEQRLMDCVAHVKRKSIKWKGLVVVVLLWVGLSIWGWWADTSEYKNYLEMLSSNKSLCVSLVLLFLIYILGFFDRHNAAHIITSRCKSVLHDFNMSCNDQGKLILKRSKVLHDPWKHS